MHIIFLIPLATISATIFSIKLFICLILCSCISNSLIYWMSLWRPRPSHLHSAIVHYNLRSIAHMKLKISNQSLKSKNKIGTVYCLKYTDIPKTFLSPQHGRWRQQVASLITTAQRNCGLQSLLLERNHKRNNGIQGHCCDVMRGHCCEPTMISAPIVATMCPNNVFGFHCWNNVFQQSPRLLLLQ
jgi:hypothetical protein